MWPWEHAVVGYLGYSVFCHLRYSQSPDGPGTAVAVGAAQVPDLVDKPLAWSLGVFESGHAVAHSVFVAVPIVLLVGHRLRAVGRERVAAAVGIGYLLHLPADLLYQYVVGGTVSPEMVLWPIVGFGTAEPTHGVLQEALRRIGGYWLALLAGELSTYQQAQLVVAGLVGLLWLVDGAPVLRELLGAARQLGEALVSTRRT